jgi:hypothetical protein
MTKYRILLALLLGAGFTSVVALSLNFTGFPSVLLIPGGIPVAILSKSGGLGSVPALLLANTLFYSVMIFAVISPCYRNLGEASVRLTAGKVAAPIVILVVLACIPRLSPLWPQGMAELERVEKELQSAILPGMTVGEAQGVVRTAGIAFQEETEQSPLNVLETSDVTMRAQTGDQLLFSRFQMKAGQFPCNYEMQVFLLFGQDGKLRQSYIHRRPVCP